jgi:hypothetical protein
MEHVLLVNNAVQPEYIFWLTPTDIKYVLGLTPKGLTYFQQQQQQQQQQRRRRRRRRRRHHHHLHGIWQLYGPPLLGLPTFLRFLR